ncbi:hypothetical protein A0H81_14652 [Grifola frondosa]|uniref:Uncharacterized protein n=1 Tax=Grifola frondosa TaxID=5627 RepID=A0A1C7LKU0_GRIFR|nr:hypothetical protein A0H81_14652 [Grifola frondosa]
MAHVLAPVPSQLLMTDTLSSKTLAISVPDCDGWPDGDFEQLFTHKEVNATNHLMAHWAANMSDDHKGNFDVEEWGDGKKSQRCCLGTIVCNNDGCNIIVRPQTQLEDSDIIHRSYSIPDLDNSRVPQCIWHDS